MRGRMLEALPLAGRGHGVGDPRGMILVIASRRPASAMRASSAAILLDRNPGLLLDKRLLEIRQRQSPATQQQHDL
jgi:hypothetical protein